uniref:Uncharacterized protein n=1 Tax=Setaria viridis TaxID=4556 RepID=A0A4U6U1X5_SETVI|nr:hypothetical protein SEVIR_6G049000v2 [Setaria viridis]
MGRRCDIDRGAAASSRWWKKPKARGPMNLLGGRREERSFRGHQAVPPAAGGGVADEVSKVGDAGEDGNEQIVGERRAVVVESCAQEQELSAFWFEVRRRGKPRRRGATALYSEGAIRIVNRSRITRSTFSRGPAASSSAGPSAFFPCRPSSLHPRGPPLALFSAAREPRAGPSTARGHRRVGPTCHLFPPAVSDRDSSRNRRAASSVTASPPLRIRREFELKAPLSPSAPPLYKSPPPSRPPTPAPATPETLAPKLQRRRLCFAAKRRLRCPAVRGI